MLMAWDTLFSNTREEAYLFKYGSCLFIKILDESKNFNASEFFLFPNATIPEKYLDKFLESIFSKLLLLENKAL